LEAVLQHASDLKKRDRPDNWEVPNFQIVQTKFTELSDSQWETIKQIFAHHRPKADSICTDVNAVLSITCTGTQGRILDGKYPKWERAYDYFHLATRCPRF